MKKKIFTEYDQQKATEMKWLEKIVLPFLKTYEVNEPDCKLKYKMFNGKFFVVKN